MASMAEYSNASFVQAAFHENRVYTITSTGILATFSSEKKLHLWVDLKVKKYNTTNETKIPKLSAMQIIGNKVLCGGSDGIIR